MAKYSLDELSIMAKNKVIYSNNLQAVMKSLAPYDISEPKVRYILEELVASENILKEYRDLIGQALVNYDEISKDNNIYEETNLKEENVQKLEVEHDDIELNDVTEQLYDETEQFNNDTFVVAKTNAIANDPVSLDNDVLMKSISSLAISKGINILSGKSRLNEPALISVELTPKSKAYIDNLLLQLNGKEEEHLNIGLEKDKNTGKEMLTLSVDGKNLSMDEVKRYNTNMLQEVNEIIKTTDINKDYESLMSFELRKIRDRFHSDEIDVVKDNDVELVYSKENGVNSYHVVAPSEQKAKEVAKEMGYELQEERGGGVFEIDDKNIANIEETKMAKASENVNYNDEVKTIDKEQGLSDLDINYNNEHYSGYEKDDATNKIMDFLEESKNDDRTISQLTIKSHGDQKVIELRNTNGYNDTVVIQEGKNFDKVILPEIANTYSKGAEVNGSRTYEENGTVGYFAESNENTRLIITGSNEEVISNVESTISKNQVKEQSNLKVNNMTYTKTLGTYPTRVSTSQSANISFVALLAFTLLIVLGTVIILAIYGG